MYKKPAQHYERRTTNQENEITNKHAVFYKTTGSFAMKMII
ncbi:hypothetical protein BSM4216_1267 [Bacillus smithii]|nr:hypothetical protein BSM4216_1267 [Bacillus smithii]